MTRLVFLDCETTGLDPRRAEPWEVALIRRELGEDDYTASQPDVEYLFQLFPLNLAQADPMALAISGFKQRQATSMSIGGPMIDGGAVAQKRKDTVIDPPNYSRTSRDQVLGQIDRYIDQAVVVGSNVGKFDLAEILWRTLTDAGFAPTWHYHPIDVASLAAGYAMGHNAGTAPERAQWADGPTPNRGLLPDLSFPFKSDRVTSAIGVPATTKGKHTALADARWARDTFDAVFKGSRLPDHLSVY